MVVEVELWRVRLVLVIPELASLGYCNDEGYGNGEIRREPRDLYSTRKGVYTTFISVIAPDIMFESDTHLLIGSYMQ